MSLPANSVLAPRTTNRGSRPVRSVIAIVWWSLSVGAIAYYVHRDALHYLFDYTPASFKHFWPERWVIRTHITLAMLMITSGPLQFSSWLRRRHSTVHRWSGYVFLSTGCVVAVTAMYMGLHPVEGDIVYGVGLFLNALFFLVATSIAYYAIRTRNIQIHREWMLRAFVLAFAGLVIVRVIEDMSFLDPSLGAVALNDLSTWVNWTVPLMITEVALQVSRMRVQTGVAA
jgi:uncharacterized membrane protein